MGRVDKQVHVPTDHAGFIANAAVKVWMAPFEIVERGTDAGGGSWYRRAASAVFT
jgi:hypothetical protein